MMRAILKSVLAAALALFAAADRAQAQLAALSDEIIVLSKGLQQQERARTTTPLGRAPGAGAAPFSINPGGRGSRINELTNPARSSDRYRGGGRDLLSSASGAPTVGLAPRTASMQLARPQLAAEQSPALYGSLELPPEIEEGPPNGLTLEAAIEQLARNNYDLKSKAYEIPQARADVLTAGLRANPFVFFSASSYPYKAYSPARPGENGYSMTVIHPFDLNHKRRAREIAASRALQVLEAQYQDAVRLAIEDLHVAFLDVLVARETLRYAEASLGGIDKLHQAAETQLRAGNITQSDVENIAIQRDSAEIGLEQARAQLMQAKHSLAALLALDPAAAGRIEPRGTIRDTAPPPPKREELVGMALGARPDLAAFRLGIQRAQADVRLLRKERISDVFLLYSPYEFRNNGPIGGQNATSWSIGAMGTIPLYNRNQGEIRRATLNVAQTRTAMAAIERQIMLEVDRAELEYRASRYAVDRIEREILPRSLRVRDAAFRRFSTGEQSIVDYLNAQKQHNEVIRQFRDAALRHRRSMLHLNTVVGQRVLP
ncbi:MAG TPA: TolC family protein [Pirellulales bacterium]|jgi:cobalt-zinc-cadmium efflux system outer membrane protein|nr:TolC family protein [Pirellulales bacterium]